MTKWKEELMLSGEQEEVRQMLIKRLEGEKQIYIAKKLNVPRQIISAFKNARRELYPETLEALRNYLEN